MQSTGAFFPYLCLLMPKKKNILVSPLDWGLGHAARITPLLRYLQKQNHHLMIGINELTASFLKQQFPNVEYHDVPSYNITYSSSASSFSLLKLIPKILKAKRDEQKWVKEFTQSHQVDLIISDSRFGFYNYAIPSIIISHQLNLQFPKSLSLFGKIAQAVNYKWLSKFQQVLVPDTKDHYLSGKLSVNTKIDSDFINPQSRLMPFRAANPIGKEYILCILSGPEPQRTIFEKLLITQAQKQDETFVIIGGKPNEAVANKMLGAVVYYNHLDDKTLTTFIENASLIISRSGYSSIMDYYTLACAHLFLVPTPSQTEQIYLAQRMKELGICDFVFQEEFEIEEALSSIDKWDGFSKVDNAIHDDSLWSISYID